jgi:uncharacterized damage-inducible protein DinB
MTMTDRSFERANDESRARLAGLLATLGPAQLEADLGGGWTVASAVAHMAFWDRWQAGRWRDSLAGTGIPPTLNTHEVEVLANVALEAFLGQMTRQGLAALAIESAEALDVLIASAPDSIVDAIEAGPTAYLLHRHRHRNEHLDQIERGLAAAARGPGPADRSYLERNEASLARLREVAGRLSPADLTRPTSPSEEGSWTVGQTLGHLAFWDRFLHSRWQAALAAGPGVQPIVLPDELAGLINAGLPPSWGAFATAAGEAAMADAIDAAEQVNRLIAALPADAPIAAVLADRPSLLDRSIHRGQHLDQIERALGG